jgi:chemotaxis methyl-accepting protein methylase
MAADTRTHLSAGAGSLGALAVALEERLGLALPPGGPEQIERRLRHRIRERALDGLTEYTEYLVHGASDGAWAALVETLTRNESRVFGAPQDFLPLFELIGEPRWSRYARGAGEETYRALSAGCGTGEEAYSIAMVLAEVSIRAPSFPFEVVGADLSRRALAAARQGVYAASRFDMLPPELRERYLIPAEEDRLAVGGLRRHTRFAQANLADPETLVPLGTFDLVLARGVLPALTPRARRIALANLAGALKPGGVLLLGPGEELEGAKLGLLPVRCGDRHAYERPGPWRPTRLPEEDRAPEPATALVAHRSPLVRRWASLLLARAGYSVETAADGTEALTRAVYGRGRGLYWLERSLPPEGGEAVAVRLVATGAAEPGRVLLLSPRPSRAADTEGEEPFRIAPVPLVPTDAWKPAPGTVT